MFTTGNRPLASTSASSGRCIDMADVIAPPAADLDFCVQTDFDAVDELRYIWQRGALLPFGGSHTVDMDQVNHSVFGNEVRFARGEVMLRVDERWTENMAPADARIVKSLTWPLRRRYGYTGTRSKTEELFGAGR